MALFHTTVLDEQIKALPTVDTASGAIATFDTDLTENLVEVKCQIVAKQASGTPSPVNPLPITTYTEMNLSHSGKNIFDKTATNTTKGYKANASIYANGITVDGSGYNVSEYILLKPNTTYTLNGCAGWNPAYCLYDGAKQYITGESYSGATAKTFTTPNNCYYIRFSIVVANIDTTQLEKGSTTTTYEAYTGTTANIPFGQTVANGVLDIGSGKLRVTHGVVDFGSFTWEKTIAERMRTLEIISGAKLPISTETFNGACSWYKPASNEDVYYHTVSNSIAIQPSGLVVVYDINYNSYADGNAYKTAVTGQTLVFELATPIEIQLDSVQIQALLNENNIWCDTGDTEVKYLLTVGKKIS